MKNNLTSWLITSACLFLSGYIFLTLAITNTNIVHAQVTLSPDQDDYAFNGDPALGADGFLVVRASTDINTPGCIVEAETVLGFDLSTVDIGAISSAELSLDVNNSGISNGQAMTMTLSGSNDDSWTEGNSSIIFVSRPTQDIDLNTSAAGGQTSGSIAFATSVEFTEFISATASANGGDDYATIIISPGSGAADCSSPNAPSQGFDSKETTRAVTAAAGLTLTGTTPTAVSLFGVEVSDTTSNILLWVSAIAFLLTLSTSAVLWRRQTSTTNA